MDLPGAKSGRLGVMRDHDDGFAGVAAEGLEGGEDVLGAVGVEVAGGFIGHNQGGIGHEGTGDGDALFLAARELAREMVGAVTQADEVQGSGDLFATLGAVQLGEQQGQLDIFGGGEHGDQVKRLEDETDVLVTPVGELRFVEAGDIHALHVAFATGGTVHAGNDVEQGGFAGTGRAHEGQKLAGRDLKRHAVERGDLDFALRIAFGEVPDDDNVFWRCHAGTV